MALTYLPLLFLLLAGLAFGGGVVVVSALLGRGRRSPAKDLPYECGIDPKEDARHAVAVKFSVTAVAFLVFDVEIAYLVPWAVVFRQGVADGQGAFLVRRAGRLRPPPGPGVALRDQAAGGGMGMSPDRRPLELLAAACPGRFTEGEPFRGELAIAVPPQHYLEVVRFLRDNTAVPFDLFVDLAGLDNLPARPRFEVVVHLFSTRALSTLRIKVRIEGDPPRLPSLVGLYAGANWAEREAYDNYGIRFDGHPDLRRILNAYDTDFHPQRKDFPLKHYRD